MIVFLFILSAFWSQTDWSGGSGQGTWANTTKYFSGSNIDCTRLPGNILLNAPNGWNGTGQLNATGIWAFVGGSNSKFWSAMSPDIATLIYAAGDSAALKGFVFKSADGGNSWINAGIPACNWVHDIIEIGQDTILAATSAGVFRSTNGGVSWSPTSLTIATHCLLRSRLGVLYAGTEGGAVYKSLDDGINWSNTGTLTNATSIWTLIEASGDTLYAGGTKNPTGPVDELVCVFKSANGGISWGDVSFNTKDKRVYSMIQAQNLTIYAGTGPDSGEVWKTQNGGATWTRTQHLPYAEAVYSLLQSDKGTIYAGTGTLAGYLYKSTDGQNWTYETINTTVSCIYSLLQTNNGFLYAGTIKGVGSTTAVWKAGYFSTGQLKSSSYLASTTNQVDYDTVTWDADLHGGSIQVWIRTNTGPDMYGVDSFRVMTSGDTIPTQFNNKGYIQYQVKLATPNNDSTPVFKYIKISYTCPSRIELTCESQNDYVLFDGLPNPFNPDRVGTRISYKLPAKSSVSLKIYDFTGRLIRTLVNQSQPPGYYTVEWDGRQDNRMRVASGVYFYRLATPSFSEAKKIILIR